MTSDKVASNLIIKSSLRAPTGTGLERVKTALEEISALMSKINRQRVNIKVNLTGAENATSVLNSISVAAERQVARAQARARRSLGTTGGGTGGAGGGRGGSSTPPGRGAPPIRRAGGEIETSRTTTPDGGETYSVTRGRREGVVGVKTTTRYALDTETGNFEEGSTTEGRSNDARKAELARQRRLALMGQTTGYGLEDARRRHAEREATGQRLAAAGRARGFTVETLPGKSVQATNDSMERLNGQIIRFSQNMSDGTVKVREFNTLTGELSKSRIMETDASRARVAAAERDRKFNEEHARLRSQRIRGENAMRRGVRAGFTNLPDDTMEYEPVKGDSRAVTARIRKQSLVSDDGATTTTRTFNEATGKLTTTVKENSEAIKNNHRMVQLSRNAASAWQHENDLISQGYRQATETTKQFAVGQNQVNTRIREFRRITGSALLGNLAVDIAKVDSATGAMTRTTLTASKAMKHLGDSFGNAVAKVGLWFAATSVIFLVARAVREAVSQFQQLEADTIFLARVGSSLGNSFQERLSEAKLLTKGITELSAVMGVDAIASQRAAAVFLRSGQDRVQALQSTKAAMLASKIAELEVEDAAKLLSSAQKQFNLSSSELIPTLDSLNSLSNKYVVSTNDLLQSISRAGKVYADSNGTLEGLAATTAIVGQTTRRSGSEIGNAIKTIQSRLVSAEVSSTLMQKLGVDIFDTEGNAKNLTKILLQLQSAMVGLNAQQQSQLMVTIAGARQVNILRNAMAGVVDIAIAEAQALRDNGSATTEAIETSTTLSSALGRLSGAFSDLVDTAVNSATGGMIASIVNLLTLILKLANSFDGLGFRLAAMSAVFIVVLTVIVRFGSHISMVSGLVTAFGATLVSTGNMANAYSIAMTRATAATQAFMASIRAALVVTAILYVLMEVVDRITNSMNAAAIAAEEMTTQLERAANAANRENRAVTGLSSALQEQIAIQRRLNTMKTKGIDVSKEETQVQKNLHALAKPLGIDYSGDAKSEGQLLELERRMANARQKAAKNEGKAIIDQIGAKRAEAELKKREREENHQTPEAIQAEIERSESVGNKARADVYREKLKAVVELMNQEKQLATDILELEAKKAAVMRAIAAENDAQNPKNANRVVKGKAIQLDFENFEKTRAKYESYGNLTGDDGAGQMIEQWNSLQAMSEGLLEVASGFEAGSVHAEKYIETLNKVTVEQEKLRLSFSQMRIKQFTSQFSDKAASSSAINTAFSASRSQLEFARTEGKGKGGMRFEAYNAIKAEVEASKADALNRAKTLPGILASGASGEMKTAAVAAQQKEISSLMKKAREGEVRAAQELLKIELEITKERVNQNKEAAKAAGLLSDEDKIKLLSQQNYFNKNPNKKISRMDAFFADSTANSLINQFNPSRLDHDPNAVGNKRFDNFFGADFGVDPKLIEAEAELKKRGLGANSPDAVREREFNEAKDRTTSIRESEAGLDGETVANINGAGNTVVNANIDLNNPITAKDFKPLIDSFENAVTVEISKVRAEMIAYIKSVWKPIQDAGLDRQGLPPISNQQ